MNPSDSIYFLSINFVSREVDPVCRGWVEPKYGNQSYRNLFALKGFIDSWWETESPKETEHISNLADSMIECLQINPLDQESLNMLTSTPFEASLTVFIRQFLFKVHERYISDQNHSWGGFLLNFIAVRLIVQGLEVVWNRCLVQVPNPPVFTLGKEPFNILSASVLSRVLIDHLERFYYDFVNVTGIDDLWDYLSDRTSALEHHPSQPSPTLLFGYSLEYIRLICLNLMLCMALRKLGVFLGEGLFLAMGIYQ